MENKGRKVIHVYFISSHTNYYFGSIAALFKNFTAAELGCTRETLAHILTYDGCWKSHTNLTHPGKYFRPSKVKIMRPTSPK